MDVVIGTIDSGRQRKYADPFAAIARGVLEETVAELVDDNETELHRLDAYLFLIWKETEYWEELANLTPGTLSKWATEHFEIYSIRTFRMESRRIRWRKGKKEEWYAKQNDPAKLL